MTREEKINTLKAIIQECEEYQWQRKETLFEIIKELEQELCGDAISRQAAIDAIFFEPLYKPGMKKRYAEEAVPAIFEKIKALPPVTPQYTDAEIQKMQDLEFAEIQKAYEIGKAENPNKSEIPTGWIPVSERLPETHQDVLLELRSGEMLTGFKAETEPYFYCHGVDGCYVEPQNVLAWQPLPEPYKASPTGEEVEE